MISLVTVNYKTADYLERMLESLYKNAFGCDFEVFVVDNASGDNLTGLEGRFPQVKFRYSQTNLGFAGGNNLAIKEAKGDYICLVNPDVVFTTAAVCQIEQAMNELPDVGIGGISLKNIDGSQQECVWRFPGVLDQLMVLLKVPHVFPNLKSYQRWKMRGFDYAKTQDVDQVMGAFFCIRRSVFDAIGWLDDGFFMWYEEVDFCKRATDAGFKVRYYASIAATHKGGSSFDRVATIKKQAMVRRSLRRYMRKHFGTGAWLLFVILNPLFVLAALIASFLKPL